MKNRLIDQSTDRKKNIVKDKLSYFDRVPVFSIIELNLIAACTRACVFCPVSNKDFYKNINAKGYLKKNLYTKILKDLKDINYSGKILFSGFSEPLLHPDIEEIIKMTKKYLPNCIIEMISNGDRLTSNKLLGIFASGLDTLSISLYDGAHQIDNFKKMVESSGVDSSKVILRRRYYEDGNYGLNISNRAGLVDSNLFRDKMEDHIISLPLNKICYYPYYMLKIDFNGDVDVCSHDWQKKFIIGNIKNESIWNIWISKKLHDFKKQLSKSDRSMEPCNACDVCGDIMGKESFDAWCRYELS